MAAFRKAIPAGWEVAVDPPQFVDPDIRRKGYPTVVVWRREKVRAWKPIWPNPSVADAPEQPKERFITYEFRSVPFVSPQRYREMKAENEATEKAYAAFAAKLADIPRHGKAEAYEPNRPTMYFPKTAKDQARVAEFEDYVEKRPLHHPQAFPSHYCGQASLDLFSSRYFLSAIEPDAVWDECDTVLDNLERTLEQYGESKSSPFRRRPQREASDTADEPDFPPGR
ncbi:MAG: hypothetical protein WD069_08565 [Planctomycetales bacterium]